MAILNGTDYDHIDLQAAGGADTNRHMLKDAAGRAMLAPGEASSTAASAHAAGSYFLCNGALYRATADIASGDTIMPNTNCKAATLGADLFGLKNAVAAGLLNGSAFDILPLCAKQNTSANNVSFVWNPDGSCTVTVNGTASARTGNYPIYMPNGFPAGMKPGGTYRLKYSSSNVWLIVNAYKDGSPVSPSLATVKSDKQFTIPADATGIVMELAVSNGTSAFSETLYPKLFTETLTNAELMDETLPIRGVVPDNTDLDTVTDMGIWLLQSGYTYTHSPFSSTYGGLMLVFPYSATFTIQIASKVHTGEMFHRTSGIGGFPNWEYCGLTVRGEVPTNTDLDTLKETGIWYLKKNNTYTHSPFSSSYSGILLVFAYGANTVLQIASRVNSGEMYQRTSSVGNFPETWGTNGTQVTNNYSYTNEYPSQHYENTYTITCTPTITADANNYLASTGDDTDRTGDIQAMLSSTGVCHLGPGKFIVTGIEIPDYGSLIGSGTRTLLRLDASVETGYAVKLKNEGRVSNMRISRGTSNPTLTAAVGTRHGVLFEGTRTSGSSEGTTYKRSMIDHCLISNFSGGGITCNRTGVPIDSNLLISDCFVHHCGAGLYIPYYSEFHRIVNCAFTYCWYGCVDNGGNNNFSNCDFSGNHIGILIDNSTSQSVNNSHGGFSNCSVNHSYNDFGEINKGTAIKLLKSDLGEIFTGMQIFYGAIVLDRCVGVRFIGANIGSAVPITITDSAVVTFSDSTFKEGPASTDSPFTQSGNTALKFTDCYLRDGTVYNPVN